MIATGGIPLETTATGVNGGRVNTSAAVQGTKGDAGRPVRSTVLLWVLAALVAVALVVGALVGVLRPPVSLAPGSPESVVQAYLQAVIDGEYEDAVGYLSTGAAGRCPASMFRDAWIPPSLTAELDDVRPGARQADVQVRLRSAADPPPFGDGGFNSIERFTLVREGGDWRISGDPWPVFACARPS